MEDRDFYNFKMLVLQSLEALLSGGEELIDELLIKVSGAIAELEQSSTAEQPTESAEEV